ncbi:TPA: acyltransferase [Enterobacter ludwigii]|nr:acyltransferase [Enterobacter ludwigii]
MHNNKLGAVEGVRGWACLVAFMSHVMFTFYPYVHGLRPRGYQPSSKEEFLFNSPFSFFFSGSAAVFVFFVLSGYILTYVICKGDQPRRVAELSIKRYPRLVIPAIASCILSLLIIDYAKPDASLVSGFAQGFGKFETSLLSSIIDGGYTTFFIGGHGLYNWVLWTMKIELIGSFILFFTCLLANYSKYRFVAAIIALAAIYFLVDNPTEKFGYIAFIIGFLIHDHGKRTTGSSQFILLAIGLYLAGFHANSNSYSFISTVLGANTGLISYTLSASLIVYSVLMGDLLNLSLSNKLSLLLGKLSFSIYLTHLPILFSVGVYVFNVTSESFGRFESAALATFTSLVATIFVSLIFQKAVDNPSMRFSGFLSRAIIK